MNKFEIDKQTLTDLNIFDSYGSNKSIFSVFNFTSTIKGYDKLIEIFRTPSSDIRIINERQSLIKYLSNYNTDLYFDRTNMDFVEGYLRLGSKSKSYSRFSAITKSLNYFFYPNQVYYLKQMGVTEVVSLIKKMNTVFKVLDCENKPALIKEFEGVVELLYMNPLIKDVAERAEKKLSLFELEELDFMFKGSEMKSIKCFIEMVYQIDAYFSVVKSIRKYNLTLPVVNTEHSLKIDGVFHPFLGNPIANDIEFLGGENVCFLTGSNMAGKSTFLKSLGVSIYLAHLGFPVPAKYMQTGIWQGLITTINLPDNLNEGYSHFYNEVLRVKYVAEKIKVSKNIFVIFDELFRGTNVKDALDGSLSVIKSFSKIMDCCFIISTHIVEVAENLLEDKNIMFKYLDTKMQDNKPIFSYKLMDGITNERIGMWIIENEKIGDILKYRNI